MRSHESEAMVGQSSDGARRSRGLLALIGAAHFLVVLDLTIVNMALPDLQFELGLSAPGLHWVVTAYAVAFGGFLLVGGRLGDVLGRRRVFAAGVATFTLASLACGIAPSGETLVGARVVQGIGAALLSPGAFAILLAAFPSGPSRTRAIAVWGSIGSLGAVIGIAAGGALTALVGWRSVFLVNIPFGVLVLAVTRTVVPEGRAVRRRSVDVLGGALATCGVAGIVFVLSNGAVSGWTVPSTIAAAGAAALALGSFALRQRDAADPLVPLGLATDRGFLSAGASGLLSGAVMLGILLLLAVYLQAGRGLSPLQAAAAVLLLRAPSIGLTGLVGRLVTRLGPQPVLVLGSTLMLVGLVLLSRLPGGGSIAGTLVPALLVLSLAVPCVFVAVSAAALGNVAVEHAGVASGLLTAFQWIGGALGLALVAAVTGGVEATATHADAVADSARAGFLACTALAAVGLAVACLGLARTRDRSRYTASSATGRAAWSAR